MEQIQGKGTDARSDLYSLGVTLHHLLTKQQPPQTVSRANDKLMNKPDPLRSVNELNPLVPVKVAQVLSSALNFDPNLRPQSARAMRDMLKEAIQQHSVIKTPTSRTLPLPLGIGLGVLLLLVGIVGGGILFGSTTANNTPVATAPATEIAVVPPTTVTLQPTNTIIPPTTTPLRATDIPVAPTATALYPTAATLPTSTPQATNTVKPKLTPTPTIVPTRTSDSDQSIYIVQEGDTFLSIAERHNTTIDEWRALNNLESNFIDVGQELKVPTQDNQDDDAAPSEAPASDESIYIVQEGDTFLSIAERHNTTVDELRALNNLESYFIFVGQELIVPTQDNQDDDAAPTKAPTEAPSEAPAAAPADGSGNIIHVVKEGEWIYPIARQYSNVTPQDILDANGISNPDTVTVGDELIIPVK